MFNLDVRFSSGEMIGLLRGGFISFMTLYNFILVVLAWLVLWFLVIRLDKIIDPLWKFLSADYFSSRRGLNREWYRSQSYFFKRHRDSWAK